MTRGHHPHGWTSVIWVLCQPLRHKGLPVNLIDSGYAAQSTLGYTEYILCHRVRSLQRFQSQPMLTEMLVECHVALDANRLGTINDRTPRRQIHAFEMTVAYFLRAKVVGEIWQPRNGPPV